jgi:choline dehydrogenase-like flavoprotein
MLDSCLNSTEIHHHAENQPAGHLMGTCRMGADPKQSVVDSELRAHDHSNLFLLGSGAFPTGAASNPTLTIAALALRSVNGIQRTLSR